MTGPRIRRLVLIPSSASDERFRRYRLARLDDIALLSQPRARNRRPGPNGTPDERAGAERPPALEGEST
jgi:hypothetical protein